MKRCVVIGSGLGGLSCGYILARNGYDVTVLEQGVQAGGCLQCFYRGGYKFETGMHFIGSADPGQTLYRLMNYLSLGDVKLQRLDPLGYDTISLSGQLFKLANGREPFIETLAKDFPDSKDDLAKYFSLIEKVAGASSMHSLRHADNDMAVNTEFQTRSINDVVSSVIKDPVLRNVVVGNSPLYAGERNRTPFSIHAFITDFYNQSAFRIVGGSDAICTSLVHSIQQYGGKVITRKEVVKIVCDDAKAVGVITKDETFYPAEVVISAIHPKRMLTMLEGCPLIRSAYNRRISNLPDTIGGFTVYLQFKKGTVPYRRTNFYTYKADTPWDCELYTDDDWPRGYLYMHLCHEENPQYAQTAEIISYMRFDEIAKWVGTRVGQRGEEYEALKKRKAEKLIAELDKQFPGIAKNIERYTTSTPLTYQDYTSTMGGGMYGVAKDITLGTACHVQHRTKIPNLILTGQNINSHGMLGVLVGTIVTCSELLGAESIYQQIKQCETNR